MGPTDSAPRQSRVPGAGPTLACETIEPAAGSSLTLLCLHGNGSHRGIWRAVARELREHRSVLLDFRGHGDSDHVFPPAYDPEHHATDLAAVVPKILDPPYALLAHSAGALAAARFLTDPQFEAVRKPAAFVWVDLDPLVPRWQVDYFRRGVAAVARTFATVDDAARGLRRIYPEIPEERLLSFVAEGLCRVDSGFRMKLDPATYERWEPGDLRPVLGRITCPTLVLRGSASVVMSAEGVAALAAGLTNRVVREVPGGHMLLLEHPQAAAAAIRDFLAGVTG